MTGESKADIKDIAEQLVAQIAEMQENHEDDLRKYSNSAILNISTQVLSAIITFKGPEFIDEELPDKTKETASKKMDSHVDTAVEYASRLIVKVHGAMCVNMKVDLSGIQEVWRKAQGSKSKSESDVIDTEFEEEEESRD